MLKNSILLSAGALAFSTAIAWSAQTTDPAALAQCQKLEGQFRTAEQSQPPSPQRREARYFANEGASWCETEHPHRGTADLEHALQVLSGHGQGAPAPS